MNWPSFHTKPVNLSPKPPSFKSAVQRDLPFKWIRADDWIGYFFKTVKEMQIQDSGQQPFANLHIILFFLHFQYVRISGFTQLPADVFNYLRYVVVTG